MGTETISAAASTIATLLILLGCLAAGAFLLRRLRARAAPAAANMPLAILAARALGGQQSLVIAQAGGQVLLLGVGRGGIALLSRLDADE